MIILIYFLKDISLKDFLEDILIYIQTIEIEFN